MLPLGSWIPISFSYCDGLVIVRKSGAEVARASDRTLTAGYCFLGVKGGSARLRNLLLKAPVSAASRRASNPHQVFRTHTSVEQPKVSIITTVYDRIGCLEQCLRSVQALEFRNYEHVIVADAPPERVLEQIKRLIAEYSAGTNAPTFASLRQRANDWGISPAALGLRMSTGKYVCFLSDDNGYMPTHFNKLVEALESDANLGFAYSSCLYDGRATLSLGTPRPGRIDLGQPLFRCELFEKYLGGTIPFREHAWDWRMIEHFLRSGVRWRHINESTFIFRLAKYPNLEVHRRVGQPQ
jgi:glycosyltransferase involved in cell wall biosynthesis